MILDGLTWLGLAPDEPPVFQSTRAARHAEVAQALLASRPRLPLLLHAGRSLRRCASRRSPPAARLRYDGRWRDRDPAEAPPGVAPAIRLKAPRDGETVVDDLVQGDVRVANAELDDMIILRSDGTPTYLHAVVVDDHDMGDHPRHPRRRPPDQHVPPGADLPGDGLGAAAVRPYPADPWRRRRQTVEAPRRRSVLEFREQGYLPEALCNYLLRLGWGHGDVEVVGREEAIAAVRHRRRRPRADRAWTTPS